MPDMLIPALIVAILVGVPWYFFRHEKLLFRIAIAVALAAAMLFLAGFGMMIAMGKGLPRSERLPSLLYRRARKVGEAWERDSNTGLGRACARAAGRARPGA